MKCIIIIVAIILVIALIVAFCVIKFGPSNFTGSDYTIPELDLSEMPKDLEGTQYEYLYQLSTVDNTNDYMAHPDSVLLKNGDILTVYPKGHGKGAVLNKVSTSGGVSWNDTIKNTPASWETHLKPHHISTCIFRWYT